MSIQLSKQSIQREWRKRRRQYQKFKWKDHKFLLSLILASGVVFFVFTFLSGLLESGPKH